MQEMNKKVAQWGGYKLRDEDIVSAWQGETLHPEGASASSEIRKIHRDNLVFNIIPQNAATGVTFGLLLDDETAVMQFYRNMLTRLLPGWRVGDHVQPVFAPFGKRGEMSTRMSFSFHPPAEGGVLPSKENLEKFIAAFPWWAKDLQVVGNAIDAAREARAVKSSLGKIVPEELKADEEDFSFKLRGGPRLDDLYAQNPTKVEKLAAANPQGKEAVYIEALKIAETVERDGEVSLRRWKAFVTKYSKLDVPSRRQLSLGILSDMNINTDHYASGSAFSKTHWMWKPKVAAWGGRAVWLLATTLPAFAGFGPAGVSLGYALGSAIAAGWAHYSYKRLSDYAIEVAKGAVEPYPVIAALRVVRDSLRAWGVARYETEGIPAGSSGIIDHSPRKRAKQYISRQEMDAHLAYFSPEKRNEEREKLQATIIREEKLETYDVMFDKRFGDTFFERDDGVLLRNRIVHNESKVLGDYATLIQAPVLENSKAWFGYKYQAISELLRNVENTQLRWSRLNPPEQAQARMDIQKQIEGMSGLDLAIGLLKRRNPVAYVSGMAAIGIAGISAMVLLS